MKQILLVLFLTAMAAVGFVVTRKLSAPKQGQQPATMTPTSPANAPDQGTKPNAGAGRKQGGQGKAGAGGQARAQATPKQGPAKLTPEIEAELKAREQFDWRSSVDASNVVRLDQAWSLPLSKVNFDAPILLYASGQPLTREEFRSFLVHDLGHALFEARAARELALWQARQRGIDGAFSAPEWELIVATKAARANCSTDQLRANWSAATSMPQAAAEALQRWSQEALLAYGVLSHGVAGLPALFQANLPEGDPRKMAEGMLNVLNEAWTEWSNARASGTLPSAEAAAKLIGASEGLAMFQAGVWHDELAYRLWTGDEHQVPEGAAGALAVGELPPSPVPAPWTWATEVLPIPTDELYDLLGKAQSRASLESILGDCLWFKTVAQRLAKEGHLQPIEAAWAKFEQEYAESKRTALPMIFVRCTMEGFPSLRAYRSVTRLVDSYMSSEPAGWDDLENLSGYFEQNRFFIEHWQPNLRLAVFPPYDPAQPLAVADWDASLAQAKDLCAKVAAGERFEVLQREQNERIAKAMEVSQGGETSDEFRRVYGNLIALSANELNASLDESIYRGLLRGTTLSASAIAHLEPGEVSQPWRTPKGYLVARLESATVGRLENEVEDLLPVVVEHYRSSHFQRYSNESMRALEITVP